ncbi:NRDE family protein [Candidatus Halobonum tyrrellensis]|uniref:NRDE family protein n=1 Tax=Candidatus Halobonum tyrrellensis G22 TaxID=1324957 RepID=V4HHZ8_9EURY|nr:NRDE family protein [Candidatus Halobonum tyrrellensis]ESP89373.1 hypothetical protein K933_04056 [Candidatus Halobonum tyrrellensis G22]
MCTLVLAWRAFADAPVVVAANRDEAVDRPSDPPAELEPGVVAPRDAEAGGTWVGYADTESPSGLFAGVTNRWVEGLAAERSRGLLVRDCLRADSAEDAARLVEESCREYEYDGFNLVLADANAALLLEWDGHLSVTNFDPGVHVVGNVGHDGTYFEPAGRPEAGPEEAHDARRLLDALRPEPGETAEPWLARAGDALGDHEFGVCVHTDRGYGTRSSSLLLLGTGGRRRYEFADGPPCETAYEVVVDDDGAGDGGGAT